MARTRLVPTMTPRDLRAFVPGASRLFPPGRVAIVRLYGPIAGGARTADWIELIRRLRESAKVPAVVLDIDSPGGSATASDDMFIALERLAAKKPLVAAIRGTGASGSYLAAMAARRIVTQPHAIVGSIGVISAGPRLPQTARPARRQRHREPRRAAEGHRGAVARGDGGGARQGAGHRRCV